MRIGIDARLITNRRGIGNLVFHLLRGLSDLPGDFSFFIYIDRDQAVDLIPQDRRFSVRVLQPRLYPIWEQVSLPLRAAHDRLDVLHCPGNTAPAALLPEIKLVVGIMDVMYLLPTSILPKSPSMYQRLGRAYMRRVVPLAARRAAAIITISKTSRDDITQYLHVPIDRVKVVPLAANSACRIVSDTPHLDAVCARYGLSRPFVLALGAVDPRKNTKRVIEAFSRFARLIATPHQLALVGLPGVTQAPFRRTARELGIEDSVVFMEFVPEDDLVALYNAATMLVYPSLYEGFGLPVLEAMACGTPVVTSLRGSIPEVAGDAALMVDPLDVGDIAACMAKMSSSPVLRRELIAKGHAQAGRYSWKETATKTLAIYEGVMAGAATAQFGRTT